MKWPKVFTFTPSVKNKICILVVLCVSILLTYRAFRPGMWSVQDDLHIFRLREFDLCLKSGQVPCRYSSNSALGFGSPVFNFYPPLTYLLGEMLHFTGLSYINSAKIIYLSPLFFGPVSMYLLAATFFGPVGGLVSAIVFATAPYQAVNVYVRGALAENFAINLVPIIFYLLIKRRQKLTILSITALFLTHQLTTIYAIGLLSLYSIYQKQFKLFLNTTIWSFSLSAFFLFPAIFEKNQTTNYLMIQGYFSYIIHFATLKQLFIDRFWGYGASLWGPKDDMSFQIGYLQWLLPLAAVICSFLSKKPARRQAGKYRFLILILTISGLFFTLLTHNKSTFVWQLFPFMAYFQFPWRFLGGVVLCFSLASGAIILFIPKRTQIIFAGVILATLFALNLSYFHEDQWSNLTDAQKLSGANLIAQEGAGLTDFYPKYSSKFPAPEIPPTVQVISGQVNNISFIKNPQIAYGQITVNDDLATINLPIAYFPRMELRLDTQKIDYRIDQTLGLIQFDIPQGTHHFYLRFLDTPVRTISNYISLLFLIAFIIKVIRESK